MAENEVPANSASRAGGSAGDKAISLAGLSKKFYLRNEAAGSIKEAFTTRGRSRRSEFWALKDIDLEVPAGSMYALVGHNGSGKSTLLRCIAGIYRPTTGTVRTTGRISALLELGSGFHPDLTGRENIYLNASIIGLKPHEVDERIDDIIDFSGISQFIDSPIKHYSSGMYVRLGFAVAVHVNPEILIIDEVITVGDEEFQRRCYDHLYDLRQRGVTIVVVSHALNIVQSMCDYAAWLDHGQLKMTGTAVEVVDGYLSAVDRNERNEGAAGVDTSANHGGSGEIVITSIEVRDNDAPVPSATKGKPLVVRLNWRSERGVEEPVFVMSVRHDSGLVVSSASTSIMGYHTGTCEGEGYVDFVIDELPLMTGSYEIYTSVFDQYSMHAFYHQHQGVRMAVRPGSDVIVPGIVDLGGRWEVGGRS